MASFTEQVRLLTDAHETLAALAKVNEAIKQLRHAASEPIKVKVQSEYEKAAAGEKKVRDEKERTNVAEDRALKKRLEDYKAIKKMNAEQGNPSFEIRYGSQQSLVHNQKFTEQLAETTKRINQLADAQKHIKQVAKDADVKVSPGLAATLANQTINRTEKDVANEEKERLRSVRERQSQEEQAAIRVLGDQKALEAERIRSVRERQSQEEQAAIRVLGDQKAAEAERIKAARERQSQELEAQNRILSEQKHEEAERLKAVKERQSQEEIGAKRQLEFENEKVRKVKERDAQELDGEKRVWAMEKAAQRERELKRREEERQIASSRTGGLRGVVGEVARDVRRNLVYGGINTTEHLAGEAYKADVERSTMDETLRQAGFKRDQVVQMEAEAKRLSAKYPTITETEMMKVQQHNVGAFGDFDKGMKFNDDSAAYIALRKDKVGEARAIEENLANLKVGEETGHIRDPAWMHKFIDNQLRVAQTEGSQYDPKSFLQMVRMEKSAKFQMSDEAQLHVMPFLGIMEGAGRAGNEIAMAFKSLSFTGKSISKQNAKEISGTVLSDGKDGYNPKLADQVSAGDIVGIAHTMDTFFKQKGFDTEDHSQANRTREIQSFAKTISNSSAREALLTMAENLPQLLKQQERIKLSQGIDAASGLNERTLKGSQDAVSAQFDNLSVAVMKPFNNMMMGVMNGLSRVERWGADHPNTFTGLAAGAGALTAAAIGAAIYNDPQRAVDTGLLTTIAANTGAIAGKSVLSELPGMGGGGKPGGILSTLGKATAAGIVIASAYEVGKATMDYFHAKGNLNDLIHSQDSPEANRKYNNRNVDADKAAYEAAQLQLDTEKKKNKDWDTYKGADPAYVKAMKHGSDIKVAQLEKEVSRLVAEQAKHKADNVPYIPGSINPDGSLNHQRIAQAHMGANPTGVPSFTRTSEGSLPHEKLAASVIHDPISLDKGAGVGAGLTKMSEAIAAASDAVASGGKAAAGSLSATGGAISSAGSAIVASLHSVAAEIASVRISAPTPSPTGGANTGPKERGNR